MTDRVRSAALPALAYVASATMGLFMSSMATASGGAAQADMPLIPRATLFGNPDRAAPQLSPDGKWISYLAAVDGVLNVWVAPSNNVESAKPVTKDSKRGIRQYFWAYDNSHLLYLQDVGGDENWKVYSVPVAGGDAKDLTPFDSIPGPDGKPVQVPGGLGADGKPVMRTLRPAAQLEGVSDQFPSHVLVGINNRDPQLHDLYKVNIATGQMELVQKNEGYAGYITDDSFAVRFAMKQNAEGGNDVLIADGQGGFTSWQKIGMEDSLTTAPRGFSKDRSVIFMSDSRGRNTGALTAVDIATGNTTTVAAHDKADVGGVMVHPTEKTIQAVAFNYAKTEWKILDTTIQTDLDYLKTVAPGEINISDRTQDDTKWLVSYMQDNGPIKTFIYTRDPATQKGQAEFLFTNRKSLEGLSLASMHPVIIKSRDGLDLVSYLTLPTGTDKATPGTPDAPLPMVLLVHGGPWARDQWGYNGYHQWLANRGYAVLSVNFRGSTGFGKDFVNAGNLEWAGKMHNDLIDAVDWAVNNKIASKDKVAIMGGSYGGYATLVGLTFTPETFACGVDIVGPSNIITLLNTIPPYWLPMVEQFSKRVGDHRTEEGRRFLADRSPITRVNQIKRPLLIGQGANDPRVKQSESDQIVRAMQTMKIPVTYVLFPDEGHGFARPVNNMAFNAIVEGFLSQHLGGRAEAISDDLRGSTVQVPAGADAIPGLKEALPATAK